MKFNRELFKKLFISIISAYSLSLFITPKVAFADPGDPSYVNLQGEELTADGAYIYRISGHISASDFSWSEYNSGWSDYMLVIEDGLGNEIRSRPIMTGLSSDVGTLTNGETEVTFDTTLELFDMGNVTVKIWKNGLALDNKDIVVSRVDLGPIRAELEELGPLVHAPTVPGSGEGGDLAVDSGDSGVTDGDSITVSIGASCSDWSTIKEIDTIAQCFADWGKRANILIIGIGVIGSVFMLPWIGFLWASGQPGNIEKGWELFNSWFWGLLLLLMSGFLIRIFGQDLFGVS